MISSQHPRSQRSRGQIVVGNYSGQLILMSVAMRHQFPKFGMGNTGGGAGQTARPSTKSQGRKHCLYFLFESNR